MALAMPSDEQTALQGSFAGIVKREDRFEMLLVPGAREIGAAFLNPVFKIGGGYMVRRGQRRMVGPEKGHGRFLVGDAKLGRLALNGERVGRESRGLQSVRPVVLGDNRTAGLDPRKKGSFNYKVGAETYHWRLPLGSLLEPKKDDSTGDEFPGDFLYNPYTGKKL